MLNLEHLFLGFWRDYTDLSGESQFRMMSWIIWLGHKSSDVLGGTECTRNNFLNAWNTTLWCPEVSVWLYSVMRKGWENWKNKEALTRCYARNTYFITVVRVKHQKNRRESGSEWNTCWRCLVMLRPSISWRQPGRRGKTVSGSLTPPHHLYEYLDESWNDEGGIEVLWQSINSFDKEFKFWATEYLP